MLMGLRTLVDRLEPWAVLLSLVGIVFWQHKGVCWAVLVGVGVVKVVRTWSEAFTPFSHDTIADLQKLDGLLRDKGYSTEDVEGIFHNNWLRFFREVWS